MLIRAVILPVQRDLDSDFLEPHRNAWHLWDDYAKSLRMFIHRIYDGRYPLVCRFGVLLFESEFASDFLGVRGGGGIRF